MNARQIIGFGVAAALLAAAAVAILNVVDASQEIATLVVLVIAAGTGTVIGVFGEPAESERSEKHSVRARTRPHAP